MPWRLCDEITHGHQAMDKPVVDSTVTSAPNALQWRHNDHDGVSNHRSLDCLLKRLIGRRTKNKIKAPLHWPLWGESTDHQESCYATHLSVNDQAMVERDRGCDNISKVDGFGVCHSHILVNHRLPDRPAERANSFHWKKWSRKFTLRHKISRTVCCFVIRTFLKQYHCYQSVTHPAFWSLKYSAIQRNNNQSARNVSYVLALCCALERDLM